MTERQRSSSKADIGQADANMGLEWVAVEEERDSEGRPRTPVQFIESTAQLRYDPTQHTDMSFIIRTGAGPEGEIIGQYKIYSISKLDIQGTRLTAKATISLPLHRQHEEAWFNAFLGGGVTLSEPGLAGSVSKNYKMKVREVSFGRKVSLSSNEYSLEARIDLKETMISFLWRHKLKIAKWAGGIVFVAVVTSLIGVLIASTFADNPSP